MQVHRSAEIQHAIEQVSQVMSVTHGRAGNQIPITARVVCASIFRPTFKMEMIDPVIEVDDGRGIDLSLDLTSMLRAYYSTVLAMLDGQRQRLPYPLQDFVGMTVELPQIGACLFGLHHAVLDWVDAADGPDPLEMQALADTMRVTKNAFENERDVAISLDGTVLATVR